MELHSKAWAINADKFKQSWYVPEDVIYTNDRNEARLKAMGLLKWTDLLLEDTDEEATYLNVPVRRVPRADKYEVDGQILTAANIEYENRKRTRNEEIDKIVAENPNGHAYVKKGGTYWMPNSNGYTDYRIKAGVYSVQEAARIVKSSSLDRYETFVLIDKEEHNNYILGHIEDLKTRLI